MSNAQIARTLRSAASALEHGRHGTATLKLRQTHRLDKSDVTTILVALRLFQKKYEDVDGVGIAIEWPDYFDALDPENPKPAPLGTLDIDTLCERINCAKVLVLP